MAADRFGELEKKAREYRGLSQKELGDKAGVSNTHISRWERGCVGISLANADLLFKALGVTVTIGVDGGKFKRQRGENAKE